MGIRRPYGRPRPPDARATWRTDPCTPGVRLRSAAAAARAATSGRRGVPSVPVPAAVVVRIVVPVARRRLGRLEPALPGACPPDEPAEHHHGEDGPHDRPEDQHRGACVVPSATTANARRPTSGIVDGRPAARPGRLSVGWGRCPGPAAESPRPLIPATSLLRDGRVEEQLLVERG